MVLSSVLPAHGAPYGLPAHGAPYGLPAHGPQVYTRPWSSGLYPPMVLSLTPEESDDGRTIGETRGF